MPLFPLPIVVLPGEPVPLHVFEERYKAMLEQVRRGDAEGRPLPFAIAFQTGSGVAAVACRVRLQRVLEEYDDGRLDILTVGEERVEIREVLRSRPYLEVAAEPFEDTREVPDLALEERALAVATRLLEARLGAPALLVPGGEPRLSFRLALLADLAVEERQLLLQERSENARLWQVAERISETLSTMEAEGTATPPLVN